MTTAEPIFQDRGTGDLGMYASAVSDAYGAGGEVKGDGDVCVSSSHKGQHGCPCVLSRGPLPRPSFLILILFLSSVPGGEPRDGLRLEQRERYLIVKRWR